MREVLKYLLIDWDNLFAIERGCCVSIRRHRDFYSSFVGELIVALYLQEGEILEGW